MVPRLLPVHYTGIRKYFTKDEKNFVKSWSSEKRCDICSHTLHDHYSSSWGCSFGDCSCDKPQIKVWVDAEEVHTVSTIEGDWDL
jgi:hypothetical protein